jgi:hypothetical protein
VKFITYILLLISINTLAQVNGDWMQSGQLKLRVNADGQLATFSNTAGSELVAGSNNHLFKFINLWISAKDNNDKLYIASTNGFNNISDFSQGPIDSFNYFGAEPSAWNQVWSVSALDIKEHRTNFRNTNYTVSDAIKNWPSNGSDRFNKYLAPFIDYDKDGLYNPAKGDYPEIIGDQASYFIVNENYSEHKASGGQPLKIEVYGMAYSLATLPNTIFVKYFIINRTPANYKDIRVSFHSGFQLGNDKDNYCGTLVNKNMVFAYNGDANDDNHFGTNKPLASLMMLNKDLASTLYITNDRDTNSGMPSIPNEHRNMMEGNWKSGKLLTFGNQGLDNTKTSKFVFPGLTDPSFTSQNWVETSMPGERSLLANLTYPSLNTKGYLEMDIAISGFEKSSGNAYDFLEQKASEIKSIWSSRTAAITSFNAKEIDFKNPILKGENFYQAWFETFKEIIIINHLGQITKTINPTMENVLILNQPGIFFICFKSENQIITKKILIL